MRSTVTQALLSLSFSLIASCSDGRAELIGPEGATAASSRYQLSVTVIPSPIEVGGTAQASALLTDRRGNALIRDIRWTSSDSQVATIDASGAVRGRAPGAVTITARVSAIAAGATLVVNAPPDTTTPPDTVPSGGGALNGSVTTSAGVPVGGGVVEVLFGPTVVRTLTVSGAGSYSTADLAPGAYAVKLHPPLTHSMGAAEPAQRTVTIMAGQSTTAPAFTVQEALYADDFQSYTTATLLGGAGYYTGNIPPGNFWSGPNRDIQFAHAERISMDATGGPFGDRAVRYDWPANPYTGGDLSTYCGAGPTVSMMPRITPPPAGLRNVWVRFTSKETPRFEHGSASCLSTAALSYKFFLVQLYSGSTFAQFGTYLSNSVFGEALPTSLVVGATDRVANQMATKALGGAGTTFGGQWHTYVLEIVGIGTSNCTFSAYMDGVLQLSVVAPILPGATVGAGWALALDIGSIINNGPDHAQSRWFRELGVYTTRPSLRPLVP